MRKVRRRTAPAELTPTVYVTLAEVIEQQRPTPPDMLVPEDRKRLAQACIGDFDSLPSEIKRAINNANNDPRFLSAGEGIPTGTYNFTEYAVILLDNGKSVEQIVAAIQRIDAKASQSIN
jgi:hypothetical protein